MSKIEVQALTRKVAYQKELIAGYKKEIARLKNELKAKTITTKKKTKKVKTNARI